MTLLTIDIGNTMTKLSVFEDERAVYCVAGKGLGIEAVEALLTYHTVDGIAYCCVGEDGGSLPGKLREIGLPMVALGAETPLPLEINYSSRASLGTDRVAAAVGAVDGSQSALVVDAGTAVTADIVSRGCFMGGNISPGLALRFRSLHAYTSRLPMVEAAGELTSFGRSTETAIRDGVVNGLVWELQGAYRAARNMVPEIDRLVLCGGDSDFLAPMLADLEIPVMTDHDAVGRGLVRIFNYNFNR